MLTYMKHYGIIDTRRTEGTGSPPILGGSEDDDRICEMLD